MTYTFRISVMGTSRLIYRIFRINPNLTLVDMSKVIKVLMGYYGVEMCYFQVRKQFYAQSDYIEEFKQDLINPIADDFYNEEYPTSGQIKAMWPINHLQIKHLWKSEKDVVQFVYDELFGFRHEIQLIEKDSEGLNQYPVCLEGSLAGPHETIPGIDEYDELLEEWFGKAKSKNPKALEKFFNEININPEYFNLEEVNQELTRIKYSSKPVGPKVGKLPDADMIEEEGSDPLTLRRDEIHQMNQKAVDDFQELMGNTPFDLQDLNNFLKHRMKEQNQKGRDDFDGISPHQMMEIQYKPFDNDTFMQLNKPDPKVYAQIPFMKIANFIIQKIKESGEIKLTATQALPPALIMEMVNNQIIPLIHYYEDRKVLKEMDYHEVIRTRIILETAGWLKIRKGYLSLTQKGKVIILDDFEFYKSSLLFFSSHIMWSSLFEYDRQLSHSMLGQQNWGFNLYLVSKYGHEKREVSFYFEKYIRAFPMLMIHDFKGLIGYNPDELRYSSSVFTFFLLFFGFVTESTDSAKSYITYYQKSPFFDELIQFKR